MSKNKISKEQVCEMHEFIRNLHKAEIKEHKEKENGKQKLSN